MKLQKLIVFVIVALGIPGVVFGQNESYDVPDDKLVIVDVGFNSSLPIGPFDRNIGHAFYGFSLGTFFQMDSEHPYVIGGEILYNYIDGHSIYFFENIDGQDIELKETTSTHLASVMAGVRYFPEIGVAKFKPYVQLSMGVKLPFTQTYLRDTDGGEFVSEYDLNELNVSISYGGAIGMNYQLSSFLFLNGKASYYPGSSTAYYSEIMDIESQVIDYSIDAFEKVNSRTPVFNYSIGVSFFF